MKKLFSNVQTLKSSEDCKKYSKSVSYETLTIGATATGRECSEALEIEGVITRRTLVRRGYLPEQGTHENKESLFTSITWLMRLPRRIQRMLLVMTIPASCRKAQKRRFLFNLIRRSLEKFFKKNFRDDSSCFGSAKVVEKLFYIIAVLFSIIPSQAKASCLNHDVWGMDCYDWNPGTPDNCGQGCTYNYNDGTLYITSDGSNPTLPNIFEKDSYENGFPVTINRAVIDGPINIGVNSFYLAGATISGANGNLVLNDIGHHGFGDNTVLSGNIIIPEGATFGSLAFHGVTLAEDAKIYCGVEDCAQKMIDSCNYSDGEYADRCLNAVNNIVSAGKVHSYPDGCTKMGVSGCTKCKNENFRLNDGECDRLRWTPAEAAQVLHNDNTNSVTITFKK